MAKQFVMPSHTPGQGDARLPRWLRSRGADAEPEPGRRDRLDRRLHEHGEREGAAAKGNIPNATNLLTHSVNDLAAARSWFVPQATNWVNVENGNILKTMLASFLSGRLSVTQAAQVASQNITQTLNQAA